MYRPNVVSAISPLPRTRAATRSAGLIPAMTGLTVPAARPRRNRAPSLQTPRSAVDPGVVRAFVPSLALVLAACLGGCSCGGEAPAPSAEPATAAIPIPTETTTGTGRVEGALRVDGGKDRRTPAEGGPAGCPADAPVLAHRVGEDGALTDVVARLRPGPQLRAADLKPTERPPRDVNLRVDGCLLSPRALVARIGDTLRVDNGDERFHSVVLEAADGGTWSRVQTLPLAPEETGVTWPLERPGLYRLRSDQVDWMGGLLLVLRPGEMGAASGADGRLELADVPAGSWDVDAHHDLHGRLETTVEVLPDEVSALTGTFEAE